MTGQSQQSKECAECGDIIPESRMANSLKFRKEEAMYCTNQCAENVAERIGRSRRKEDPVRLQAFNEKHRLRAIREREERVAKGLCVRCGGVNDRKISEVVSCSGCSEYANTRG